MAINNKAAESKYNVKIPITGVLGVIGSESETMPCHVETKLRVEVDGVGPSNEIQIYGRIRSSELWHYIATITGPVTGVADISTYDFIRYFHTVSDGVGTLVASGFVLNISTGGGGGGDATAANQVIGNNSLSSLNNRTQGSFLSGVDFDKIEATYPTTSTELYSYSLDGILKAQILVTYTNASKSIFVSAERL